VNIFTIGFSVPGSGAIDTQGIQMLKTCAGDTRDPTSVQSYVANDAASLVAAFQKVAEKIGGLKLTQ